MRGGSLRSGAAIIAKCRDFQIAPTQAIGIEVGTPWCGCTYT